VGARGIIFISMSGPEAVALAVGTPLSEDEFIFVGGEMEGCRNVCLFMPGPEAISMPAETPLDDGQFMFLGGGMERCTYVCLSG
jgi:hypothetical protein